MRILTTTQRTPEWAKARLGMLTASCAHEFLAKVKSGEAAGRRNLRIRLVLERMTGVPQENEHQSGDMLRGAELEGEALSAYEAETGNLTSTVGFLAHDTLMAGCSPDGVIGDYEGLLELKCPKSATHLDYLRGGVPGDYLKQVQHALWITGAAWADFVSYDPRFPSTLRLKRTRITMSEVERKSYEIMVRAFLDEVDREVEALTAAEVVA